MAGCMEGSSSQGPIQWLLIGLILPKDKYKGTLKVYVTCEVYRLFLPIPGDMM